MLDGAALVFDMGLYQARLPAHLRYSEIHFWFDSTQTGEGSTTRCGLTSFAARLLSDVFRLEWKVTVGQPVADAELLGEIESMKASSELYAPMAGRLCAINAEVVEKPLLIAQDPYAAWLLEFEGLPVAALDVQGYHHFLAEGWEETQRLLKGQM